MGDLSEHFSTSELRCPHCGACVLDPRLVPALELLRTAAGGPVIVDSGYRCSIYNSEVGGVSKSQHMMGEAADVKIPGKTLQEMYDLAETVPAFRMGGIGVYDGDFIHVDVREEKTRWARVDGHYMSIGASGLLKTW
jgi:uncharacterized protein YcbK (DUF882 family)